MKNTNKIHIKKYKFIIMNLIFIFLMYYITFYQYFRQYYLKKDIIFDN